MLKAGHQTISLGCVVGDAFQSKDLAVAQVDAGGGGPRCRLVEAKQIRVDCFEWKLNRTDAREQHRMVQEYALGIGLKKCSTINKAVVQRQSVLEAVSISERYGRRCQDRI